MTMRYWSKQKREPHNGLFDLIKPKPAPFLCQKMGGIPVRVCRMVTCEFFEYCNGGINYEQK